MTGRLVELARAFLKLGLTSFGGPIAHLAYFRAECVERRRWLDDDEYADIVALCQFLPGPSSSQVVFTIGMKRGGLAGALVASIAFVLPSALLMIAFAYGAAASDALHRDDWLHGLKIAAVAVVAQAVWAMSAKLCPDRSRRALALLAAIVALLAPGTIGQVAVVAGGAIAGALLYRDSPDSREVDLDRAERGPPSDPPRRRGRRALALAALVAFVGLLVAPPIVLSATGGSRRLMIFDAFYRAGALVFGGGHVVLPLLRAPLVTSSPALLRDEDFLAGYGAAQAVPGPLFSLAAYLGTVIARGPHRWVGGVACLAAIYLPSCLLLCGALPFWRELRAKAWMQSALRGTNAAVVGILLAALYTPVITGAVKGAADAVAALVAFVLLERWKAPPWAVVLAAAAAGRWLL